MQGRDAMQPYQPTADSRSSARPSHRPRASRPRAHDAVVAACDVTALEYFVGKTTAGRMSFEGGTARRALVVDDPVDRRDRRESTRNETLT